MYFHEGLTWTALTSSTNSFRYSPVGSIFDSNKGPMLYTDTHSKLMYILAFLNSRISRLFIECMNPTLSLQNGDMDNLPFEIREEYLDVVSERAFDCVLMARSDWDAFEISWDFTKHPLI